MQYFGQTDIGKIRRQNQDSFFCTSGPDGSWCLLVVCDGMGGAKAGNVASGLACSVFSSGMMEMWDGEDSPEDVGSKMLHALGRANQAVYDMAASDYECRGMGTTIVAVYMTAEFCTVLNVGDSRVYHLKKDGIFQITHDHSYVQTLLDAGEISPQEARTHKNRNIITRAVGTTQRIDGDLFYPAVENGEKLLLCSDGLSNQVSEKEIWDIAWNGTPEGACSELITLTLQRGAPDNTTAVICVK